MASVSGTRLVFRHDDGPESGFEMSNSGKDAVTDIRAIRELMQNALDASLGTEGQPRELRFKAFTMPLASVPHIGEYQQAFKSAVALLGSSEPPTGKNVIKRIERALARPDIDCLACIDRGAGISSEALVALYSQGRSNKKQTGLGSVGNGHLTAFAPSDLRYVLYAGRSASKVEVFGGHAVLATHQEESPNEAASAPVQLHHDGFIRNEAGLQENTLFNAERGGERLPPIFDEWLPSPESGSVVLIVGYQEISDPPQPLRDQVLSTAARYFLVALYDRTMAVSYEERREGREVGALARIEDPCACVHAIADKREQGKAERTLRTLRDGTLMPETEVVEAVGRGVRIWMRTRIEDSERRSPRVSIHRDGMHIEDNNPSYLTPGHFSGLAPFDVVVDLDSGHDFGELVREAEGASHDCIKPKHLAQGQEQKRLRDCLSRLRDYITNHAEQAERADSAWTPDELIMRGSEASRVPKRKPKHPREGGEGAGSEEGNKPGHDDHGDSEIETCKGSDSSDGNIDKTPKQPSDGSRSSGNRAGVSTSCRPDVADPLKYQVSWAIKDGENKAAELRMLLPSGTDQTSDKQIPPTTLRIATVIVDRTGAAMIGEGGSVEVSLGATGGAGSAVVVLAPDPPVPHLDRSCVVAEVVRRAPK